MQDRWDAGQVGYKTRGMYSMTGRMQERKDEWMKGRWDEEK